MRANLNDFTRIERHGYKVTPLDCGTGPVRGAWVLTFDGAPLMIGEHGCVAPTQRAAVAEAFDRIDQEATSGT